MDSKTMQRMRKHITDNEGEIATPYKDNKGKLTVGTGFLVDDEKFFVAMPFQIKDPKTGEPRPATEAEKKAEFQRAKGLSNDELRDGPGKSPLSLPKAEIDSRLDAEITTRVDKIKKEVGEADWNKLTPGQQTAVLDVHYANGDLGKFNRLKEAIKAGDAKAMAEQSDFHGGTMKGSDEVHRNFDRIRRNRAEMLGIDPESPEAYRAVADKYRDHPSLKDNYKKHVPPTATASAPPAPDRQEPPEAPAATSQPEPAPESPPEQAKPDKAVESEPADPAITAMLDMAAKPIDHPGRAALLKPAEKLTEAEMKAVIDHAQGDYRGWKSGDPMKAQAYETVQDWHLAIYGDAPQTHDGGKPIEPKPIRPIPAEPAPHATPSGEDLWQATSRLGGKVAEAARQDGAAQAITGLQRGLNLLNQANPPPARSPAYPPYSNPGVISEDGVYGPQTDFALKQATARLGPAKVENGLALGRFNAFARAAQKNANPEGLEAKTHAIFGPLLRKGDDGPKPEAGMLQETLNDYGAGLKVDDWIGPKTTQAFGKTLESQDAVDFARAYGRRFGLI